MVVIQKLSEGRSKINWSRLSSEAEGKWQGSENKIWGWSALGRLGCFGYH